MRKASAGVRQVVMDPGPSWFPGHAAMAPSCFLLFPITVVLLCVYLLQMRGTFCSETLWDYVFQVTLEFLTC